MIPNKVSLFGITLEIESIPFQAQDQGVSACATIAIWTALRSLTKVFDINSLSPAEITEASTSFPSLARIFPQSGLNLEQMITGIRSMNLDVEVIESVSLSELVPELVPGLVPEDHLITTAIKAYLAMGVPLIAALRLERDCELVGCHAVVITGYRCDSNGHITELYVHDDQIRPYSEVLPNGDFRKWLNEWTNSYGFDVVRLEKLIVPVYHKISQVFLGVYIQQLEMINKLQRLFANDDQFHIDDIDVQLFLSSVQDYKANLLQSDIANKTETLLKPLPLYIWVLRVSHQKQIEFDIVYDGTAVYPRQLLRVEYG